MRPFNPDWNAWNYDDEGYEQDWCDECGMIEALDNQLQMMGEQVVCKSCHDKIREEQAITADNLKGE